jgi:hypothetical protein
MKTLTREAKERTLTLTAEVKDYALFLRTELATGKVESGRKKYEIEVSVPVNGSAVLVQISQVATKKNPSPGWRTYAIERGMARHGSTAHRRGGCAGGEKALPIRARLHLARAGEGNVRPALLRDSGRRNYRQSARRLA